MASKQAISPLKQLLYSLCVADFVTVIQYCFVSILICIFAMSQKHFGVNLMQPLRLSHWQFVSTNSSDIIPLIITLVLLSFQCCHGFAVIATMVLLFIVVFFYSLSSLLWVYSHCRHGFILINCGNGFDLFHCHYGFSHFIYIYGLLYYCHGFILRMIWSTFKCSFWTLNFLFRLSSMYSGFGKNGSIPKASIQLSTLKCFHSDTSGDVYSFLNSSQQSSVQNCIGLYTSTVSSTMHSMFTA